MARTPNPTDTQAHAVDLSTSTAPGLVQLERDGAVEQQIATRLTQASDGLRAVGRLDAMNFYRSMSEVGIAVTYTRIKRDRLYLGIPYTDADGQVRVTNTLAEFCEHLMPLGYRRCEDLAANLRVLGEDLYKHAQSIGVNSQQYAALRKLPDDDKQAVLEVLEGGDKDAVLTTLADLVARQKEAREQAETAKAKAEADLAEKTQDYEALSAVAAEKDTKIRKLQMGVEPPPPWDVRMGPWLTATGAWAAQARQGLAEMSLIIDEALQMDRPTDRLERAAYHDGMKALFDAAQTHLVQQRQAVEGALRQIEILYDLADAVREEADVALANNR